VQQACRSSSECLSCPSCATAHADRGPSPLVGGQPPPPPPRNYEAGYGRGAPPAEPPHGGVRPGGGPMPGGPPPQQQQQQPERWVPSGGDRWGPRDGPGGGYERGPAGDHGRYDDRWALRDSAEAVGCTAKLSGDCVWHKHLEHNQDAIAVIQSTVATVDTIHCGNFCHLLQPKCQIAHAGLLSKFVD